MRSTYSSKSIFISYKSKPFSPSILTFQTFPTVNVCLSLDVSAGHTFPAHMQDLCLAGFFQVPLEEISERGTTGVVYSKSGKVKNSKVQEDGYL